MAVSYHNTNIWNTGNTNLYNNTTSTTGTNSTGAGWLWYNTSAGSVVISNNTIVNNYPTAAINISAAAKHLTNVAPNVDPRIINKYLNASDLLGEFIKDLGHLGVKQDSVLGIPIELFINWLIVKSAEEDGRSDEVKDIPKLPSKLVTYRRDRCRACGRFITRAKVQAELFFCSGAHLERLMA